MDRRAAIGVDVGGTGTKAGVVDRDGAVLARSERPTDPTAGTKGIIGTIDDLLLKAGRLDVSIAAIGVGAAGFVDAGSGSVTFSPNLTYDDPEIATAVEARVGIPTVVDNDANAAAWGERKFGAARGSDHVALITLGTGIGSGFIVEGRLVRGFTGAAAELGHMVVDPDGPQCPCGLRGCLEQLASGTAIARLGKQAVEADAGSSILSFAGSIEEITAEHVGKAAREYDDAARSVLRRAGTSLGVGLSNVANLFDPEMIVLGGGVVAAGEPYLGAARDTLVRMTQAQRRRAMRLDVTSLGRDGGIIGAAALAYDEHVQDDA
ncbi:MAG TPA: ROK family glucokinase [Actinomycetota bacterium]|jgi:glucokinase